MKNIFYDKPIKIITSLLLIIFISGCSIHNEVPYKEEILPIYDEGLNNKELLTDNMETLPYYTESSFQLEQEKFDNYTEQLVSELIVASPMDATFLFGNLDSMGYSDLLSQMDTFTPQDFSQAIEDSKNVLMALENINYDLLTYEQKLTYDMLSFQNNLVIEGEPYTYYYNEIEPISGAQISIPLALMQIEFKTEDEIIAYLERLAKLPDLFRQMMAYEKTRKERGLLMPAHLYELVIEQINQILVPPEDFMMYKSFCEKLESMTTISDEKKENYKGICFSLIVSHIYPVYNEMKEVLLTLQEASTVNTGIISWPQGKKYYEYIIKSKTSYDLSVEELREWAYNNLIQCLEPIETFSVKYSDILNTDNIYDIFPKYESLEDIYTLSLDCLSQEFYDYGVSNASERTIPTYLESYLASGFYFPVSIDGEAYGNMYLQNDTYNIINQSTVELYFHENIPGHHMYFSIVYNSDIPMIRKICSWLPYEEGWAQYAQTLAYNYYNFEDDLVTLLQANADASFYYMVLMDIQIHYDGIPMEDAIQTYMALGYTRESAESIVNRIVANPGEIIHYVYGSYKMKEYLQKCQSSMGDNFEIKDFHDLLFNSASLPFTTMDYVVDDYIFKNNQN